MKTFISIVAICISLSIYTIYAVKKIKFNQNCGGYLKRAANANTIEIAQTELIRALKYMEEKKLTNGYTSVLWRTPNEDIGFWYNNIKASFEELKSLAPDATSLEKSNMLIKLRETLTDQKEGENSVTLPDGISRYPNNLIWGIYTWLASLILFALFIRLMLYTLD